MTNYNHVVHHTGWYKFKHEYVGQLIAIAIGTAMVWGALRYLAPIMDRKKADRPERDIRKLELPVTVEVTSTYKFLPKYGIQYKRLNNVGLTFYAVGDGYTPGITTRSGRYVYDGAIAVSQNLWNKDVFPGDLIWVKATGRWYKCEDTMAARYTESRVDIFTHDMSVANSGASRTDIIIIRQPTVE